MESLPVESKKKTVERKKVESIIDCAARAGKKFYLHYTSQAAFSKILFEEKRLTGGKGKVYVSTPGQQYGPNDVWLNFFFLEQTHKGRGECLIIFESDNARLTEGALTVGSTSTEIALQSPVDLSAHNVLWAGSNPFKDEFAPSHYMT